MENLRLELTEARQETEMAHKWRLECADVCGILTMRLKELAEFLDSLLKHKDILGVLAQDRRKAMRKAVDKSLDLSNSLNKSIISVDNGRFSFNDSSLLHQFSSLSDILNMSDGENKENLSINNITNQSLPTRDVNNSQTNVIEHLKAEVRNLKT